MSFTGPKQPKLVMFPRAHDMCAEPEDPCLEPPTKLECAFGIKFVNEVSLKVNRSISIKADYAEFLCEQKHYLCHAMATSAREWGGSHST